MTIFVEQVVNLILINDFSKPQILEVEKEFLLVYKPPRMHSIPLVKSPGDNILEWCSREFPEIKDLAGNDNRSDSQAPIPVIPVRPALEGGVLHRLDYETHGLMLVARTLHAMTFLIEQQKNGKTSKEYSAITGEGTTILKGFPDEKPKLFFWVFREKRRSGDSVNIKSAFRPYGPGRKAVRPVVPNINVPYGNTLLVKNPDTDIALDGSRPYVTEIISAQLFSPEGEVLSVSHELPEVEKPGLACFNIRIVKGFRHQIRSHLAWIGRPILNDSVYGGITFGKGLLGLRACSISFTDPSSGEKQSYSIPPLHLSEV